MLKSLWLILQYDTRMTMRRAFSWLTPLLFFIMVVSLFPLSIGPDKIVLHTIAPGVIWVAALLSIVISIGDLFRYDAEEGYLEILLLSSHSLTSLVFCRILSYWMTHCLPLIIISPLLGYVLNLQPHEEYVLMIALLLGTPILCLLGAIGSALVIGIRNHGLLLPILIMPLYIPVLIFGSSAVAAASLSQPVYAYYAILGALLLVSLAFAPLITGIALRIGVNQ
jgi:heme exporter protein B